MKTKLSILLVTAGLAACSPAAETETSNLKTATVNGRAYDVFYDPYAGDHAIIFGRRNIVVEDLPKAEIISQATPCKFDSDSMIAFRRSEMTHPMRPDLENLGWVPVDCSEA